jgi:hypothetical protein
MICAARRRKPSGGDSGGSQNERKKFPPGWDAQRVKELIEHYENQTEDEEFADIEAAREAEDITLTRIIHDLCPSFRNRYWRYSSVAVKRP